MSTPAPTTSRTAAHLRRAFLDFFKGKDHVEVPSAPLVPNDPTLLFTTAGMVQFKPYYTATGDVPYTRATSVQKCLRLTDLDNVGNTPRHGTFFEMLGNFSFGPREKGAYFKEEAIAMAWEFVTQVLQLPKERLYASIFAGEGQLPRDDEAAALWRKIGVAGDHIVALGRADNFWGPAGGQGACGPCSEIYFDLGEARPADLPDGAFWGERPGDAGDRYMEFWNLVFPQFDAKADGTLTPLPRPGIDTGMGLDRLALLMQDKRTIFDTDLHAPVVTMILDRGQRGGDARLATRDARVIADHSRALVFAIAEGALPGNEGAGYVLRRLLRRAVTRGRSRRGLGMTQAFLPDAAELIVEHYGDHYRELRAQRREILKVLAREEEGFAQTFEGGLTRFEELLAGGAKAVSGRDAFVLHDTYGFPVELTQEMAAERGVTVDLEGFEQEMEAQRTRARAASRFTKGESIGRDAWVAVSDQPDSAFLGYDTLEADHLAIRSHRLTGDSELELVLDRTPFYAESGGQVADRGRLEGEASVGEVVHVFKEDDHIVHRVAVRGGDHATLIAEGAAGRLKGSVDPEHRRPTMRHHTATHLLHAALRQTLGTHVRQAGSLVAPDRLRFDYTHFEAATPEQLAAIERLVAEWVLRNREVTWKVMPIAEAKALGAMALFGEKYGAEVRVVTVPGVADAGIPDSLELCGGTHVGRTGDIGAFVLVADTAIASGVRRIEALCGHEALDWLRTRVATLDRAAAAFQAQPEAVPEQIERLRQEVTHLKSELVRLASGGLEKEMDGFVAQATAAPGGRWFVAEVQTAVQADALRTAADRAIQVLGRGGFVVLSKSGEKSTFLAAVSDDLVKEKKLRADELVRKVAQVTGGSGGGKPHLALAGGKDAAKLGEALDEARRLLAAALA